MADNWNHWHWSNEAWNTNNSQTQSDQYGVVDRCWRWTDINDVVNGNVWHELWMTSVNPTIETDAQALNVNGNVAAKATPIVLETLLPHKGEVEVCSALNQSWPPSIEINTEHDLRLCELQLERKNKWKKPKIMANNEWRTTQRHYVICTIHGKLLFALYHQLASQQYGIWMWRWYIP